MYQRKSCRQEVVYEINTYEQLRELDDTSKQLDSDVIHLISEILACSRLNYKR